MNEERANPAAIARRIVAESNVEEGGDHRNEADRRLGEVAPRLLAAGREVLANWERGDLAAAVRAVQAVVDEFDAANRTEFEVWNETDQVHASPDTFPTREAASAFVAKFRKRFDRQGFYRTVLGERIAPEAVDLVIRPLEA